MEYINKSIFKGIAGKMPGKPKAYVIHNDAGSKSATAKEYVNSLPHHNPDSGFAHYYIDRFTTFRAEDTFNSAWHCGNSYGNTWYLSYEVVQSGAPGYAGCSDAEFLANEQATFKQVADDMKYYGHTPSRSTIILHRALSATACPWRSWQLHVGRGASDTAANRNKLVDYYVKEVKKYMGGASLPSKPSATKPPATKPPVTKPPVSKETYITTNPKKVKLKTTCGLYAKSDIGFTGGKVGGEYKKGTIFDITGITHSKSGVPRLITSSGFLLTANVKYVEKVGATPSKPFSNLPAKGTFRPNTDVAIKHDPKVSAAQKASLGKGESVVYSSLVQSDGYLWAKYGRANGYTGYACAGKISGEVKYGTFTK